ncbi:arg8-vasotocin receptor-like [Nerophis ophidion]|uniref:arg8-vasotocin receptor-like n=1 Tax=Nerophis ophidion TaxID=159077 RepID=UPI002ADF7EFE|nr:arg8-vasotocin receptor-like [Nerophis ophidion]XP_061770340.1 arg8-vasotocin receptor-like [Nerophis ophidion]
MSSPTATAGNLEPTRQPVENVSSRGPDPWERDEALARMEIIVLSVAFVAATVGNASMLLALRVSQRKPSRVHLFMTHLSLADLVVAFFQVLPQLYWQVTFRFRGPDFLCRGVKFLQVVGMFASAYVTVAMTVDRYVAVCHPMTTLNRPKRRARAMIACAWACSLALSTPQVFIFSMQEVYAGSDVYDCWADFIEPWGMRAYTTWITADVFLVPVAVLVTCYGFICRAVWTNGKWSSRGRSMPAVSRGKVRTIRMTLVIVLAYVTCWAPFFSVQMWSVWDDNFTWHDSDNMPVTLSAQLASLNSCVNPWIYLMFSGHLMSDFARRLPCCRRLGTKFARPNSISSPRSSTQLSRLQGPRLSESHTAKTAPPPCDAKEPA